MSGFWALNEEFASYKDENTECCFFQDILQEAREVSQFRSSEHAIKMLTFFGKPDERKHVK